MKIPHSVVGQTRPSSQGLNYLRPAEVDMSGLFRGLRTLQSGVAQFAGEVSQRNDNVDRMDTLTRFSQFQSDVDAELLEMKRQSPADDRTYSVRAAQHYTKREKEFLAGVRSDWQPEFKMRTQQVFQRVAADSLSFQYSQQDSFFKTKVDEQYQKAKNGVFDNPDTYDAWSKSLGEMINSTDLPAAEKAHIARTIDGGLRTIIAGRRVEEALMATPGPVTSSQLSDDDVDVLVRTVMGEAGGEGPEGQSAVASVVLNRVGRQGKSVWDVVMAPNQFEAWTRKRDELAAADPNSPEYQAVLANIQPALQGMDVTGGATLFYAPEAQASLGRAAPKWATGEGTQIGGHTFFREGRPLAGRARGPGQGIVKELQGERAAVRKGPLADITHGWLDAASAATGLAVEVTSGGQPESGPNRTGSHRHDRGGAADLQLRGADGHVLDMRNPEDQGQIANFIEEAVAAGATGVGAALGYMGASTIHVGGGSEAVWGAGGKVANAEPWVKEAVDRGRARRGNLTDSPLVAAIWSDPFYDNVKLEDRIAIEKDAITRISAQQTEAERAAKEALQVGKNDLYVKLHDGDAGYTDINVARNNGLLTDIDDIEKAEKIVADRLARIESTQGFNQMLSGAEAYNSGDIDHVNMFDDWVGDKGRQTLAEGSVDYRDNSLLPAVGKMQDIPPKTHGMLESMTRSENPDLMRFAYDTLASIEDIAPQAYRTRTDDVLEKMVDLYRGGKNSMGDEEFVNFLRGGSTPAEMQASAALDPQARQILYTGNNLAEWTAASIGFDVGDPSGWWYGTSEKPSVAVDAEQEFAANFVEGFRRFKNDKDAKKYAQRRMEKNWGASQFAEPGSRFMRLPPEKIYPPQRTIDWLPGSGLTWDVYWEQLQADAAPGEGEELALEADRKTLIEKEAYANQKTKQLPSYKLWRIKPDGTRVLDPDRWWGVVPSVEGS